MVFIDNIAIFIHEKVKETPFVDLSSVIRVHFLNKCLVDILILFIFVDIEVE